MDGTGMKLCDYCGKENQDEQLACRECGTSLAPKAVVGGENLTEPPMAKDLTPGRATAILFGYLGVQFLASSIAFAIGRALYNAQRGKPARS
jgi:hypothetical protein